MVAGSSALELLRPEGVCPNGPSASTICPFLALHRRAGRAEEPHVCTLERSRIYSYCLSVCPLSFIVSFALVRDQVCQQVPLTSLLAGYLWWCGGQGLAGEVQKLDVKWMATR